jgi:rubredoxin
MGPLLIYCSLLIVPLVLAIALRYLVVVPTRECIQCDRVVAVTAFSCRHCGHRYTAEDRELMRLAAEARRSPGPGDESGTAAVQGPVPRGPARRRSAVRTLQCVDCSQQVALSALSCLHCGHWYTAEERDLMRGRSTPG